MIRLADISSDYLPRNVREVAEVIGRDKALALTACVVARGSRKRSHGTRGFVHIPESIGAEHWIAQTVGAEAARELSREFRGMVLELSSCANLYREFRDARIREMAAGGVSVEYIADDFGLTARQVQNIVHRRRRRWRKSCQRNQEAVQLTLWA